MIQLDIGSAFALRLLSIISLLWAGMVQAELVCTADAPAVAPGGQVRLRTWTSVGGEASWTADNGSLSTGSARAVWTAANSPGLYKITAQVRGEVCVVQLLVDDALRGARETGYGILVRDRQEPRGYGLYSYFLLGVQPDDSSKERVLSALRAYLRLTPSLQALEGLFNRSEINANLIPVTELPPSAPDAAWLLDHYDFARARFILHRIEGTHRRGPYLASALTPPSKEERIIKPVLFQDLSAVPPHLIDIWYEAFLNQAAQERFWQTSTLEHLALGTRTMVGVLALGLPEIKDAVSDWVNWIN